MRTIRYCSDVCRQSAKNRRVVRENERNRRLNNAAKLSQGCAWCGYNKSARALHYHHKDPAKKTVMIRGGAHLKTGKLATERDEQCILLCANCHYEQHERAAA